MTLKDADGFVYDDGAASAFGYAVEAELTPEDADAMRRAESASQIERLAVEGKFDDAIRLLTEYAPDDGEAAPDDGELTERIRLFREKGLTEGLRKELERRIPMLFEDGWPEYQRLEFLVDLWLPRGEIGIFVGRGGSCKSTTALQLCAALASGQPWLGTTPGKEAELCDNDGKPLELQPCPVVYAGYEGKPRVIRNQIISIDRALGGALKPHIKNLKRRWFAPDGALWSAPDYRTPPALTTAGKRLQNFAKDVGARLLVIDPLFRANASNENDRAAVGEFISHWAAWADDADCSVLLVAHTSKNPSDGKSEDDWFSGSTAWRDGARFGWSQQGSQCKDKCEQCSHANGRANKFKLEFRKGNDAPPPDKPIYLRREGGAMIVTPPSCGGAGVTMVKSDKRGAEYDDAV